MATSTGSTLRAVAAAGCVAWALAGCGGGAEPEPTRGRWVLGADMPAFDVDGPPDPIRASLERLLTRGLVEEDPAGDPVAGAAESIEASDDSLRWTFRLSASLRFTDGTPCGSAEFRDALTRGLPRTDHGTRAWELAAVRGVRDVRAGQALPPLGIETPDERTVVLRLAVPDPELLRKLARPGVGRAWRSRETGPWRRAVGLGPYRLVAQDSARSLELVRAAREGPPGPDTLALRFVPVASRVRSLLRDGQADLVWPLPAGMLAERLPAGYRVTSREARPSRWMVLVMRADVPPTTRLAVRQALSHGVNPQDLQRALGQRPGPIAGFIPGGGPFEFPRLDPQEIQLWRERGQLGRSFHVVLLYDARGAPAEIARLLQGEWSRHDIYAELRSLWGNRLTSELLTGRAHVVVAVHQDPIDTPGGAIACWVMPPRGPAVGSVRTGWRTREFDGRIVPGGGLRPVPASIQRRLEQERVVLPLAPAPWTWVERTSAGDAPYHGRFGPSCPVPGSRSQGR